MNSFLVLFEIEKNIVFDAKLTEIELIKTGARKICVEGHFLLFLHFRCFLSALKLVKVEVTHYHSR